MNRTYIWDLPTRLVHWLLVALVFFSWGSAEYNQMDLHRYSGYALLGVVVFRVYWGFFGSNTARFTQFVKGPRAIADYLRGNDGRPTTHKSIGHNPLGALSVLALLALLLTQIGLGLFAVDVDGLESGPLSYLVSFDVGRACAEVHEVVFNLLLAMIVLHVVAIFFYLFFKRDNLLGPMITGNKAMPLPLQTGVSASPLRVAIGVVLSVAVVWLII
jgi:cytochrome b